MESLPQAQAAALHLDVLFKEAALFANHNPGFRKGWLDKVVVAVTEGDRDDPVLEDDLIADCQVDDGTRMPLAEYSYIFEANRYRYWDHNGRQDARLTFQVGFTAINHNILLPEHIAEDQFGMSSREVVDEVGYSDHVLHREYTLTADPRKLETCESHQYIDADEDVISDACTCQIDEPGYFADGELLLGAEDTPIQGGLQQYSTYEFDERSSHEPLAIEDIEQDAAQLFAVQQIGDEIESSLYLSNVLAARTLLRNIRRAVLRQAGVDPALLHI